jgi:hypothetical protein
MNCLENKSENQVLELSVATALSRLGVGKLRLGVGSLRLGVASCAWAWARGYKMLFCVF